MAAQAHDPMALLMQPFEYAGLLKTDKTFAFERVSVLAYAPYEFGYQVGYVPVILPDDRSPSLFSERRHGGLQVRLKHGAPVAYHIGDKPRNSPGEEIMHAERQKREPVHQRKEHIWPNFPHDLTKIQ